MKVISLTLLFLAVLAVKADDDADCGCTGTTTVYAPGEMNVDGKNGRSCTNKEEATFVTKCSGPDDTFSAVEWDGKLERTGEKSTVTTACLFDRGERTNIKLTCTENDGTTRDVTTRVRLAVGCKCKAVGGIGKPNSGRKEKLQAWKAKFQQSKGNSTAIGILKDEVKKNLTPAQLAELKGKWDEKKAKKQQQNQPQDGDTDGNDDQPQDGETDGHDDQPQDGETDGNDDQPKDGDADDIDGGD